MSIFVVLEQVNSFAKISTAICLIEEAGKFTICTFESCILMFALGKDITNGALIFFDLLRISL